MNIQSKINSILLNIKEMKSDSLKLESSHKEKDPSGNLYQQSQSEEENKEPSLDEVDNLILVLSEQKNIKENHWKVKKVFLGQEVSVIIEDQFGKEIKKISLKDLKKIVDSYKQNQKIGSLLNKKF